MPVLHPIRRGVTTPCPLGRARLPSEKRRPVGPFYHLNSTPMKTFSIAITVVALLSALLAAQSASSDSSARPAAGGAKGDRLYHVVSLKFKKSATKEQI